MTQREMPWLSLLKGPAVLDDSLMETATDMLEAVQLCAQKSRMKNEQLRKALCVTKGHMTKIMQGNASLPLRKLPEMMEMAGNIAPLQYLARRMGYELVDASALKRLSELESLLAKLKDAA